MNLDTFKRIGVAKQILHLHFTFAPKYLATKELEERGPKERGPKERVPERVPTFEERGRNGASKMRKERGRNE